MQIVFGHSSISGCYIYMCARPFLPLFFVIRLPQPMDELYDHTECRAIPFSIVGKRDCVVALLEWGCLRPCSEYDSPDLQRRLFHNRIIQVAEGDKNYFD